MNSQQSVAWYQGNEPRQYQLAHEVNAFRVICTFTGSPFQFLPKETTQYTRCQALQAGVHAFGLNSRVICNDAIIDDTIRPTSMSHGPSTDTNQE
jgi:hypothetical protein